MVEPVELDAKKLLGTAYGPRSRSIPLQLWAMHNWLD
jgi:hypothetical protein